MTTSASVGNTVPVQPQTFHKWLTTDPKTGAESLRNRAWMWKIASIVSSVAFVAIAAVVGVMLFSEPLISLMIIFGVINPIALKISGLFQEQSTNLFDVAKHMNNISNCLEKVKKIGPDALKEKAKELGVLDSSLSQLSLEALQRGIARYVYFTEQADSYYKQFEQCETHLAEDKFLRALAFPCLLQADFTLHLLNNPTSDETLDFRIQTATQRALEITYPSNPPNPYLELGDLELGYKERSFQELIDRLSEKSKLVLTLFPNEPEEPTETLLAPQ